MDEPTEKSAKRSKFDSNFTRVEKDFYRTFDTRPHNALNKILPEHTKFVEPCAGSGDLIHGLEVLGHECVYACDIEERELTQEITTKINIKDAMELTHADCLGADAIITNPPWTRSVLHPMIRHFSSIAPTWLLFEADWMHTKQAIPFLNELCTDIVSVGRVKWIENSSASSLKDVVWYCFDTKKTGATRFYPRDAVVEETPSVVPYEMKLGEITAVLDDAQYTIDRHSFTHKGEQPMQVPRYYLDQISDIINNK